MFSLLFASAFLSSIAAKLLIGVTPGAITICGTSPCDSHMVAKRPVVNTRNGNLVAFANDWPMVVNHVPAEASVVTLAGFNYSSRVSQNIVNQGMNLARFCHGIPNTRCFYTTRHLTKISFDDNHIYLGSSHVTTTYQTTTRNVSATTVVKYGKFGACSQKFSDYFTIAAANIPVFPITPLATPSWVIKGFETPGVYHSFNLLNPGVYKFDVTYGDVKVMNEAASQCLDQCRQQNRIVANSCQFASYGYEDGVWFCKMFKNRVCSPVDLIWTPAAPSVSINNTGEVAPLALDWNDGCRISDLIPSNTPTLPGKPMVIEPNTPFATVAPAPYNPDVHRNLTDLYGSIRCSATDATLDAGWPTFGTVWL